MHKDATKRAIELAVEKVGSLARVAENLTQTGGKPLTRQAISQWVKVPPRHVLALEELSGVSRYELRPDVFGPAPAPKRSRAA